MDLVDGIILVLLVLAILHGRRVGAVAQLLSFIGIILGIAIGVALVVVVDPHVHGTAGKTLVAAVLLIAPASLLSSVGRHLGYLSWRALRRVPIARPIDAAIGSVVAVCGTLVVCWLFASILVNSELPSLSAAVSRSRIVRGVESVMPPVPNAFATVQRYLSTSGFPQVLVNILPESVEPVALPPSSVVDQAALAVHDSVLKVIALGCGDEQEGSSFAISSDIVATNAHVIAGTSSISVISPTGESVAATPVYFNPTLDLALLRLQSGGLHPLSLDPNYVERGNQAVVLGYPNGGPYDAQPAGVLARFYAQGRDIYDNALANRVVYELQADVQPGNSGGPLLASNGTVLGVVFSRSADHPDIGYALASPGVLSAIDQAQHYDDHAVSTQSCTT